MNSGHDNHRWRVAGSFKRFGAATEDGSRSFTLVELLVSIAVISILMSMLMPALKSAKDVASSIQCLSNVRALGTGYQIYAGDYNGYCFPGYVRSDDGTAILASWRDAVANSLNIKNYNNDTQRGVWRCPAAYATLPEELRQKNCCSSYGKNYHIGGSLYFSDPWVLLTRVKRPSVVVCLGDSDEDGYYPELLQEWSYLVGNRHNGSANLSFLDGHGARVRSKDYIGPGCFPGLYKLSSDGQSITYDVKSTSFPSSFPVDLSYKWGIRFSSGADYLYEN